MKKRLLYHLFYDKKFAYADAYRIHYYCLKQFANIFDDVIFIISLNNVNDYETIQMLEKWILSIGFKGNLQFKIVQNTEYREAKTFYDEIICKLDEYEGLTFWAHCKGITNNVQSRYMPGPINELSILKWICGMYAFSLIDMNDVKYWIGQCRAISYGNPMILENGAQPYQTQFETKFPWRYYGSIYWLNTRCLSLYMKNHQIGLPVLSDRYLAEEGLCNIYPMDYNAGYNRSYYISNNGLGYDLYNDNDDFWKFIYGENPHYNAFLKLVEETKEFVKNNKGDEFWTK